MSALSVALEACGLAVITCGLIGGTRGRPRLMWRLFLAGNAIDVTGDVITRSWVLLAVSGMFAVFSAWMLWRGLRLLAAAVRVIPARWWTRPFRGRERPWPCGWAAWCAPGREAEAAEILKARGILVTRVTAHPAIPDREVILVNPDSGYRPGGIISP